MGCGEVTVGEMKHRIAIETKTRVTDGMGGGTITWANFSTVWSKIEPRSANETFWAKHLEHRVTHKITIRYLAGVTSEMRIVFGARVFQIKGVRNLEERNRWLVLDCEEGVPA